MQRHAHHRRRPSSGGGLGGGGGGGASGSLCYFSTCLFVVVFLGVFYLQMPSRPMLPTDGAYPDMRIEEIERHKQLQGLGEGTHGRGYRKISNVEDISELDGIADYEDDASLSGDSDVSIPWLKNATAQYTPNLEFDDAVMGDDTLSHLEDFESNKLAEAEPASSTKPDTATATPSPSPPPPTLSPPPPDSPPPQLEANADVIMTQTPPQRPPPKPKTSSHRPHAPPALPPTPHMSEAEAQQLMQEQEQEIKQKVQAVMTKLNITAPPPRAPPPPQQASVAVTDPVNPSADTPSPNTAVDTPQQGPAIEEFPRQLLTSLSSTTSSLSPVSDNAPAPEIILAVTSTAPPPAPAALAPSPEQVAKQKAEREEYLRRLFGMWQCDGCRYLPALQQEYAIPETAIHSALDIGTGGCGLVRGMLTFGWEVKGVEAILVPLKEKCSDLLEQGVVRDAKLDKLPFADASFDMVTSTHVLEFLPHARLATVIKEMVRVARMHVFITISVHSQGKKPPKDDLQPVSLHTAEWWQELLEAHGLTFSPSHTESLRAMYQKAEPARGTDAIFALVAIPQTGPDAWGSRQCLGCSYFKVAAELYANEFRQQRVATMLVAGAGACRLAAEGKGVAPRGSSPDIHVLDFARHRVSADCPSLLKTGSISFLLEATPLPLAENTQDLVLSLHQLEMLPEDRIDAVLNLLVRLATKNVMIVVATCGSRIVTPDCPAAQMDGIQALQSRLWWANKFKDAGLEKTWSAEMFEPKPCGGVKCSSRFDELANASGGRMNSQDLFTFRVPASKAAVVGAIEDLKGGLNKVGKRRRL
eukprot:jgi/Chlat1/8547/Chrsp82S07947